jgi:GT2 family glycosyltransferase
VLKRKATLAVVIATRDRPRLLADCLDTLVPERHELTEIVIVDDGSVPDAGAIVVQARARGLPVTSLRTEGIGVARARNAGAAMASAQLVAFLDDDTLVDPGWATAITGAFKRSGAVAVGGRIRLSLEAPAPRWLTPGLRSYLGELELGGASRWMLGRETPFGGNCAVDRDAFTTAGGFPDHLGHVATGLLGNEDVALFGRFAAEGRGLLYAPAAGVRHRVGPERLVLRWLCRRAFAQGISDEVMARGRGSRPVRLLRNAVRCGRAVPILAVGVVRGADAVPALVWLAYCAGRLSVRRRA